jgi:hAT family C-terminal dimerisation region
MQVILHQCLPPNPNYRCTLHSTVNKKHINPVQWWTENRTLYPILYKMAMDHMVIPATSVSGERIFSDMSQICEEGQLRVVRRQN